MKKKKKKKCHYSINNSKMRAVYVFIQLADIHHPRNIVKRHTRDVVLSTSSEEENCW